MITEGQWINFQEFPPSSGRKLSIFSILTKQGISIGEVKWYGNWRQYCFFPDEDSIYDRKCMMEVINFINKLMEDRKNGTP